MKVDNWKLTFNKNDSVFLKQLALTAMSAQSMKAGKGPVTHFPRDKAKGLFSSGDIFFSSLPKMTFDLKSRRFEVAGPPHWYRNRFFTKKATGGANAALADAEAKLLSKAGDLIGKQIRNAQVKQIEEFIQRRSGLSNGQMKRIRKNFFPVLVEVASWREL